jgi:hypothetical protein
MGAQGAVGGTPVVFTPTTCEVIGPDASFEEVYLLDLAPSDELAPGQSVDLSYSIDITANFDIVPEPSPLSILVIALLVLGAMQGRRHQAEPDPAEHV